MIAGGAWWRWAIFTAAAVVSAVLGVRWTFGARSSQARRVAGAFVLLIVAAWVAGAGGQAISAWIPAAVAWVKKVITGGAAVGTQGQGAQGQG